MKLLLDEMYPAALAAALRERGIDASTVAELRLTAATDPEVFAAAQAGGRCVLTENVSDFVQVAAECSNAGRHHAGLILALSSRFSRRPAGVNPLAAAIGAIRDVDLRDRIVFLREVPS